MQTIGILGMGEVGRAVSELAQGKYTILTKDLDHDTIQSSKIDILHVCIPYSDLFVQTVKNVAQKASPGLIIINATVAPGTTRSIGKIAKTSAVHAPIMGVHPHLAAYQTQFTKVIGTIDDKAFLLAKKHWLDLGAPKIARFDSPEDSELAKLLCTTYYGWNIIFNKMVKKLTEKTNTNFEQVYTRFSEIYNEGYAKSLPHVRRPILKHMQGPIGGHCVIPNLHILSQAFNEQTFAFMLEFNEQLSQEK
jgi:UDP-N-acetyl-D-mannosaminuronate dehydrogenase